MGADPVADPPTQLISLCEAQYLPSHESGTHWACDLREPRRTTARATACRCPVAIHRSEDPARVASAAVFGLVTLTAPDGVSPMEQTLWPRHCVQDTWGSQLHPELKPPSSPIIVYKGTDAVTPRRSSNPRVPWIAQCNDHSM